MSLSAPMFTSVANPFGAPITRARLTEIENSYPGGFWNATPPLQKIAAEAAAKRVSPVGVLTLLQEHRATHVPPNVVLVQTDGTCGMVLGDGTSLNGFTSIVSRPGGGKTVTFKVATALSPHIGVACPDGTSQGIVRHLAKTVTRTKDEEGKPLPAPVQETVFHTHAVMVHAPEIGTLNAEFERSGSKTAPMMRSMWIGETVGMNNGESERKVIIPPNMARICGAWGVHPVKAVAILAQADEGTPQRFVWAPAKEIRTPAPARKPAPQGVSFPMPEFTPPGNTAFGSTDMPPTIDLKDPVYPEPIWVHWSPQMKVDIAAFRAAEDALYDREPYAIRTPEQADAEQALLMRSHFLLTTIKSAVKMGWLHGRANPSDLDWELAKIQMLVSEAELAGAWFECSQVPVALAKLVGEMRAVEQVTAEAHRELLKDAAMTAVEEEIFTDLCKGPKTMRDIKRRFRRQPLKEKLANKAVENLIGTKRVEWEEQTQPTGGRPSSGFYWAVVDGVRLGDGLDA